ncbi:MAG: hypothetical protein CBB70_04485 [Planctomycetaceae bacterium TMED10]|nr:MAG: hypothetical protein CBB70_04485 [Planctomycetaceae bacterium TMED10]
MCSTTRKNRLWHYVLALVVAGLPLGMIVPCLCGAPAEGGHCCAVEDDVCQLTSPCCASCNPAKPCCCQEKTRRQPLTRLAKSDQSVRQSTAVSIDAFADTLGALKQGTSEPADDVTLVPSLRLHAVLGIWLN